MEFGFLLLPQIADSGHSPFFYSPQSLSPCFHPLQHSLFKSSLVRYFHLNPLQALGPTKSCNVCAMNSHKNDNVVIKIYHFDAKIFTLPIDNRIQKRVRNEIHTCVINISTYGIYFIVIKLIL